MRREDPLVNCNLRSFPFIESEVSQQLTILQYTRLRTISLRIYIFRIYMRSFNLPDLIANRQFSAPSYVPTSLSRAETKRRRCRGEWKGKRDEWEKRRGCGARQRRTRDLPTRMFRQMSERRPIGTGTDTNGRNVALALARLARKIALAAFAATAARACASASRHPFLIHPFDLQIAIPLFRSFGSGCYPAIHELIPRDHALSLDRLSISLYPNVLQSYDDVRNNWPITSRRVNYADRFIRTTTNIDKLVGIDWIKRNSNEYSNFSKWPVKLWKIEMSHIRSEVYTTN